MIILPRKYCYILKDSSQNLGELTVSFTTTKDLSFDFKPTEKK